MPRKVLIMGAAGRDFHNFNVMFRNNRNYTVVAFTASQIPDIAGRRYPPQLAGRRYPKGIPIYPEEQLTELIKKHNIDEVVFAYSDVAHEDVMHKASIALAAGADFTLLGPHSTMLKSTKPVIAVCAVRTGAGKSPTSQYIVNYLMKKGLRVGVIRHPMPYGDLAKQAVQRFARYADFEKQHCTIEEREEYEPYVRKGVVIFAGVDYEKILRKAEREVDVVLWDGGNNDFSFYQPDMYITIADPHRPGHEMRYHPGETNLRLADVILISKVNTASKSNIATVENNARKANPHAHIIKADITINVAHPGNLKGKRVLVIEDGPTLTHGSMGYGAGMIVAQRSGARVIDASRYAVGSIKKVYTKYPHLKNILPAMGYGARQIRELEQTINRSPCDVVIEATPLDLSRLIKIKKPLAEVSYALAPPPALNRALDRFAALARRRR